MAGPTEIDSLEARLLATEHLGLLGSSDMTLTLATVSDRHPFGESKERGAWLATAPSVCVEPLRGAATWYATLHVVIDATDGRLILAFTSPKAEWVKPGIAARDPEEQAREFGWSYHRLDTLSLRSSIPQVLGSYWSHIGDPAKAGQIVLRPRWVSWSAVPRRAGDLTGEAPARIGWIVQVLGTVTWPGEGNDYFTGLIARFHDEDLALGGAVMMP
ncbi:MAG: hypothetical protein ACT4PE_17080 [Candidatus Eiseniibacteriota bacterium]